MDFDRFLELLGALEREGVDYVLVGGVAVNLHGIVRATEDIDLFVRPEVDNLERLKAALRAVWNDPVIDEITASDFLGDYPTLRYGPPDDDVIIDVLTRLGTRFRFEDLEGETLMLEGVKVRVATPATLLRMKTGTLRPIDRADARALAEKFGLKEQ
jgi:hypothetical protein